MNGQRCSVGRLQRPDPKLTLPEVPARPRLRIPLQVSQTLPGLGAVVSMGGVSLQVLRFERLPLDLVRQGAEQPRQIVRDRASAQQLPEAVQTVKSECSGESFTVTLGDGRKIASTNLLQSVMAGRLFQPDGMAGRIVLTRGVQGFVSMV